MGYEEELEAARKAVQRTVEELKLHRRTGSSVRDEKSEHPLDTVTRHDLMAEEMLVEELSESFDYGFLTEEEERDREDGLYWCIDPVDGTTNFSRGFPPWGVSVALVEERNPVVGVVALLPEGRLFSAIKGSGAYVEEGFNFSSVRKGSEQADFTKAEKLRVSDTDKIGESMIKTANNDKTVGYDSMVDFVKSIERKGASTRNNGCCTADLCRIAEGVLDGRANANLERWDVDAARLILSEAGGEYRMRRRESGKIELIASNGLIQEDLEEIWDRETS